jgi:N4-(beta-N-acetylglucosaminyl)-L-asparaginase
VPLSRRDFLATGASAATSAVLSAGAGLAVPAGTLASQVERAGRRGAASRPIAVASDNGVRGVARAVEMMRQGVDPLDAAIAGVNIQELDPADTSVGLGGLPNEDGVVQLDASVMHGPTKRAGSVGAIEGIATPSLVAKAVMDYTDHVMLVGEGAKRFALQMGFKEQDLLTPESRQAWLRWKAAQNKTDAWLDHTGDVKIQVPPPASGARSPSQETSEAILSPGEHRWYDERGIPHTWGTINMCAVDARGDIGSVTTTSGRSWKLAGRIGDSPVIGAGQYCDNDVGAAGSTGRGEAAIKACGSFLAVEFMRQGMTPEQALIKVMERVIAMTEKRLLDERGRPYFDLQFYAVNKQGVYAGASAYEGSSFAVADERGARLEKCVFLFKESERPKGSGNFSTLR